MLLLSTPIFGNEPTPDMSFLKHLAEEGDQSWMIFVLDDAGTNTTDREEEAESENNQ